MTTAILGILGSLAALGYGLWRKYGSPEAELARLKEREAARQSAVKVESEQLRATYARIDKEKADERGVIDRLSRPIR